MAKSKKRRNKSYTGENAKVAQPTLTRISAVHRNPLQQWWHEKKRVAKPVIITALVVIAVVWLLIELIRAIAS